MLNEKQLLRFWKKVDKKNEDACWNWIGNYTRGGYGSFRVGLSMKVASRISWEIHFGEIPKKLHVLHKCDNPACVNPKHLFLGTDQDNSDDKIKKGRQVVLWGEKNLFHKLSDAQVLEIRRRYALGNETQEKLGKEFGVSISNISHIVTFRSRRNPYE